jgi:serine/threonine-protein kinase HipA
MSKLNVFYEKIKVGELNRDEDLVYSFAYDPDWLHYEKKFPLSLALPLREEAYGNKHTLSFFENLLPEGEVRNVIGRAHQVESPYEFLREFGGDCAGAVIVTDKEHSPFTGDTREKILIDMEKVYQAIEQHHSVAHVIAQLDPGYLSLAGAQDKFPAILEDGQFYLPKNATPTTHIVKVPINREGVKESVYNEYYCMQLAKAAGLNVPHTQIIGGGIHPLFVIDRYDREKDKNGIIHRIHQQDFCQAQGIVSEQKYEAKGGPSLKDNYALIVNNVGIKNRLSNTYAFLDWVCFNLLIGNNDSHSKNISFLLRDGRVELAPFYDLLSTAIYPKLKRQFSFKIGDRDDFSSIGKKQFEALDADLGLKVGTMAERLRLMNKKVLEYKDPLADSIKKEHQQMKIAQRISEMIEKRSRSFKQQGFEF